MGKARRILRREILALRVHQWPKEWRKIEFAPKEHRRKPAPSFLLLSMSASHLKALTGISRRTTGDALPRSRDLGIQRRHDEERSKEIRRYVRSGYPWSTLSKAKRESGEYENLRKPGWLPTAIVVNILQQGDTRRGRKVTKKDLVRVVENDNATARIWLPKSFSGSSWTPEGLHPFEVIDGQHRLWAFEGTTGSGSFELPVVAFYGLDVSWQAYLFWTINVKPKRINASLAFDLYPLLRTESWLEEAEGHLVYRETRCQELVETLWAHPESPWHQWINMLGEPTLRKRMVSQAAWVRSLMATFVKSWEGRRVSIGGLYGAPIGKRKQALPWSRAEQAALLILVGQRLRDAVRKCRMPWAKSLRKEKDGEAGLEGRDAAFFGRSSLLNTDIGTRGLLFIANDMLYAMNEEGTVALEEWGTQEDVGTYDEVVVTQALRSLKKTDIAKRIDRIVEGLVQYDWRTSNALGLTEAQRVAKLAFRGGSGYKELRRQLLRSLSEGKGPISETARVVYRRLGYDRG